MSEKHSCFLHGDYSGPVCDGCVRSRERQLSFNAGFDAAVKALVGGDREIAKRHINFDHPDYQRDRQQAFVRWAGESGL